MSSPSAPHVSNEVFYAEGWTLEHFASLPSTNPVAGRHGPWYAARAAVQTDGRGRTGRSWTSDTGGLWLSAVLPTPEPRDRWAILPLAIGWAAIEALTHLGAPKLRLRWPNDLMAGRRKLAGLLVEKYRADAAVIGLGLNVHNRPEATAPGLAGDVVTLADLLPGPHSLDHLTWLMLRTFRGVHARLESGGFAEIARQLNGCWESRHVVELLLHHRPTPLRATFVGIDDAGRVCVADFDGKFHVFAATEVAHFREIE